MRHIRRAGIRRWGRRPDVGSHFRHLKIERTELGDRHLHAFRQQVRTHFRNLEVRIRDARRRLVPAIGQITANCCKRVVGRIDFTARLGGRGSFGFVAVVRRI
jgi:hypothetical protein